VLRADNSLELIVKPIVEKSSARPPYQGNYTEVVEVFQREFGVTRGDDPKPVLATYGLGPCVAMVGWSPEHKVGFLISHQEYCVV